MCPFKEGSLLTASVSGKNNGASESVQLVVLIEASKSRFNFLQGRTIDQPPKKYLAQFIHYSVKTYKTMLIVNQYHFSELDEMISTQEKPTIHGHLMIQLPQG